MDYSVGNIGRVVAARFHDDENVYAGILAIAAKEKVQSAMVFAVGGARRAKVVVGPKQVRGPIDAIVREFDDAREMVGFGTIFPSQGKPSLHLHAAIGRGQETIVGCPRLGLDAFLVLEVLIVEVLGLDASRELDAESALRLLAFAHPKTA